MISLKKHMERVDDGFLTASTECYRSALVAMANSGARACPALGESLRESLLALRDRLSDPVQGDILRCTSAEVEQNLGAWGDRAAEYYTQKAVEIKEVVLTLARAAETLGTKDERYKTEFHGLTRELGAIAGLEDLAQIRTLLANRTSELASCVERMVKEGEDSVARLRADLAGYEERLAEAERLAGIDTVTGLKNRQGLEAALAAHTRNGERFSVIVLDLNEFNRVNDECGHLAGDHVLHDFGAELKGQLRAQDTVGRWGGDEFVVVLECDSIQALAWMNRVKKWAFGEYKVQTASGSRKVSVSAATGIAEWRPGIALEAVFRAADEAMYQDKAAAKIR